MTSLTRLTLAIAPAVLATMVVTGTAGAARPRDLALHPVRLDLPGAPSAILPADLNQDGNADLLVVLAYTEWGSIGEDRIEGMVQVVDVVPALFDRREVRVWIGDGAGGYSALSEPMPLPTSVLAVEPGPSGFPVLALTDEGVSVFRVREEGGAARIILEPVLRDVPVLSGAETFFPGLRLLFDLDGDGSRDLLLPSRDGLSAWRWTGTDFGEAAVQRLSLSGDRTFSGRGPRRRYPIPEFGDLDGDGSPDLMVSDQLDTRRLLVHRGIGGARFADPAVLSLECIGRPANARRDMRSAAGDGDSGKVPKKKARKKGNDSAVVPPGDEVLFVGDLDGKDTAEVVLSRDLGTEDGLDEAREPHSLLSIHKIRRDLTVESDPYTRLEIRGHPFSGQWPELLSSGFEDLDGDGRKDLVTVTLDFSVLQIVRVLATKRVSLGLDFHIWCQQGDGTFQEVKGLDLSEKMRFDLNDLKLDRLAQFQGDFDGDGRLDFVHLGRGSRITIHRGQPHCRYGTKPDLTVDIGEEPQDLSLVRIADLDGDGRSDLSVTRLLPPREAGLTTPVRLDLYLSGEAGK